MRLQVLAMMLWQGRGSGNIQLGSGRDKLVIDEHDTLGRTTLFDFTFGEDELVIHPTSVAISVNNNSHFMCSHLALIKETI